MTPPVASVIAPTLTPAPPSVTVPVAPVAIILTDRAPVLRIVTAVAVLLVVAIVPDWVKPNPPLSMVMSPDPASSVVAAVWVSATVLSSVKLPAVVNAPRLLTALAPVSATLPVERPVRLPVVMTPPVASVTVPTMAVGVPSVTVRSRPW